MLNGKHTVRVYITYYCEAYRYILSCDLYCSVKASIANSIGLTGLGTWQSFC